MQKAKSEEKRHHHHRSTSHVSEQCHEKDCSNTETKHISRKHKNSIKKKAVKKKHTKRSSTRAAASASQATKTSEKRTDKKYSPSTASKFKKFLLSPSLDPFVQRDSKQNGQRRIDKAPRTQHDSSSRTTDKPASSSFKGSPKQKRIEEFQNSCKGHQAKDVAAKRSLFTDATFLSASNKNESSSPAKDCTSRSSSGLLKEGEGDTSLPPKPAQPPSAQDQILAQKFVPFKFRIPKKPQLRTTLSSGTNDDYISSNKTPEKKSENKLPEGEVLKKKPEIETVHPCGSCGYSCNSSSERQDGRSSSSVQLPLPGVTNTTPCYDQVITSIPIFIYFFLFYLFISISH